MTMIHLGLSVSGNRFATEITCTIGMVVFYGMELVLGHSIIGTYSIYVAAGHSGYGH